MLSIDLIIGLGLLTLAVACCLAGYKLGRFVEKHKRT